MSELLSKTDMGSASIRRSFRKGSSSAAGAAGASVRNGTPQSTRGSAAAVLRTARTPMTAHRIPAGNGGSVRTGAAAPAGAAARYPADARNTARAAGGRGAGASAAANVRSAGASAAANVRSAGASAAANVQRDGGLPVRASQSSAVPFLRFMTATAGKVRRIVKAHTKTVISVAAVAASAVCLCIGITAAVKLSNRTEIEPVSADIVFGALALSDGGSGGQNEDGATEEDNAVSDVFVYAEGDVNIVHGSSWA